MLFDTANIHVISGPGGDGAISFRREKFVPRGGPDGGDGGGGGSVYLIAASMAKDLRSFHYRRNFRAPRGGNGMGKNRHGKNGEDLVIVVPIGTLIQKEDEVTKERIFIADLNKEGERVLVARGGKGGRGNARFATATHQVPRVAEKGEPGEAGHLFLELKLLADVGIIGYPNVGKSTLLAAVTAAQPKIGRYPFTTKEPNLGVVESKEPFVMADIPGLIEGAHMGRGLGHQFLRHI
ncbi:MAG: GTPase ObgE, partial [Chloroflexi bacterium]|nr:GTPase ObgE [Chloroflexota bacterium]